MLHPTNNPFDFLLTAARSSPKTLAVCAPDGELTYTELLDSAVRLASVLRDRGVRPGQLVAVRAPALLDVALSQALFHEAAVGAHLPVGFEHELAPHFDWVLTTEHLPNVATATQILIDGEFFAASAEASPLPRPVDYSSTDALCRVSFSSGTTGVPKAIGWSVDCLHDRSVERMHQWMPDKPYLCLLGLPTGLAFMSCIAAFAEYNTFLIPATGAALAKQIERFSVRVIMGSPKQLSELLGVALAHSTAFSTVHTVMSAGSTLPDFLADQLTRVCGAEVISTYASSEAGSIALRGGVGTTEGYAGRLFDEVKVRILDDSGRQLDEGESGHIGVRRARQPQNYLFTVEPSEESFREGFFYSGDTGYIVGRDLYLNGRVTEIINASGTKVDPARYESTVLAFPGISDAAVFGVRDQRGVQSIALVFVSENPIPLSDFTAWLGQQFGDAVPTAIARVATLQRSPMGKLNRSLLSDEFADIVGSQLSSPS